MGVTDTFPGYKMASTRYCGTGVTKGLSLSGKMPVLARLVSVSFNSSLKTATGRSMISIFTITRCIETSFCGWSHSNLTNGLNINLMRFAFTYLLSISHLNPAYFCSY